MKYLRWHRCKQTYRDDLCKNPYPNKVSNSLSLAYTINRDKSQLKLSFASRELLELGAFTGATNKQQLFSRLLFTYTYPFNQSATRHMLTGIQSISTGNWITRHTKTGARGWDRIRVTKSDYESGVLCAHHTFTLQVSTILARAACCPTWISVRRFKWREYLGFSKAFKPFLPVPLMSASDKSVNPWFLSKLLCSYLGRTEIRKVRCR